MIRITPLAAREPYKAAAAGPLSTDILSISSGFISIKRLEVVEAERMEPSKAELPTTDEELSKITPSTTKSG